MMELSTRRNSIRTGWLGLGVALLALACPLAGLGQATNPNRVRDVSTFAGATQDAQIASCFADLPPTGGICDARSLPGTQTWANNPFVSLTKPATLLLGPAIITTVTFGPPPGFGLVRMIGAGANQTIFTTSSTSAPILQCPQSGQPADADYFEGFSVKAPSSNSSANAIDLSGCRTSTFKDISYLSNGQSNFASFIHLAAHPGLCYGNRIVHYMVAAQTGPKTVILFDNNGTSQPFKNANENYLIDAWIYGNRGITTIIDARRSTLTIIRDGLFESNPGATVLIPGGLTTMTGVWIERDAPIAVLGQQGSDGSSNAVSLLNNYLSAAQTFQIQPGGTNWTIEGNWPDSNLTVMDQNGGYGTNLVRSGSTIRSTSNDFCWHVKNGGAGNDWGFCTGNGSGLISVPGGLVVRDMTNRKNVSIFSPNTSGIYLPGSSGGAMLLQAPASGGGTVTGPPGSDTLVGVSAPQMLTNKTLAGPIRGNNLRLQLTDMGTCTMSGGSCSPQPLASTYSTPPTCFATWTGAGTLSGQIRVSSTSNSVTPASSSGGDTARVNWACYGN